MLACSAIMLQLECILTNSAFGNNCNVPILIGGYYSLYQFYIALIRLVMYETKTSFLYMYMTMKA